MYNNVLQAHRIKKGMSVKELAGQAHVDEITIYRLESGRKKARRDTLTKLANALNVDVNDFLDLLDNSASRNGKLGAIERAKKERPLVAVNQQRTLETALAGAVTPAFAVHSIP